MFEALLTRLSHVSYTDSLLMRHVTQYSEYNKPGEDTCPTVNGGEDQTISEKQ